MNGDQHSIKILKENNYDIEKNIKLLSYTKIGQNRDVWFTFKFVEMIFSGVCLGFHMIGALNEDEPQPHIVYFCGTFVTFFVLSLFGQLRMLCGASIPPLIDSMIAVCGSVCFFFAAFATMHLAELDFHLKYLSDEEEAIHFFFANSKRQSISALICGSVYLLHSVYVIDSYIVRGSIDDIGKAREKKFSPTGPIQLELFYRPWLEKIKFFHYFYERIETIEAVAVWKRLHHEVGDDNLGPGINIYVFEEPITEKLIVENITEKCADSKLPNYINVSFENEKDLNDDNFKRKDDGNLNEFNEDIDNRITSIGSSIEQEYKAKSEFDIDTSISVDNNSKEFSSHFQYQNESGSGSSQQNYIRNSSDISVIIEDNKVTKEKNGIPKNDKEKDDDEVRKRTERKRDRNTQVDSDSFDTIKMD